MLYQMPGSLEAMVGPWEADMFPNSWKNCLRGNSLHTMKSIPRGFEANQVDNIQGYDHHEIVSNAWVAGSNGWSVESRYISQILEKLPTRGIVCTQ